MYSPGDSVLVTKSRCGYSGPGTIICHVFGMAYMVQVDWEQRKLIVVRFNEMRKQEMKKRESK